jgi:hypothetical protein
MIQQRLRQAFNSASGPLSTKDVFARPWFQEHGVRGATAGQYIAAMVRAHEIRKVRDGVYVKSATGSPAASSSQAKQGNGASGPGLTGTTSQRKRVQAQTRKPAKRANSTRATNAGQPSTTPAGCGRRAQGTKQPQNAAGLMNRISTLEQQVAQLTQFIYGNS